MLTPLGVWPPGHREGENQGSLEPWLHSLLSFPARPFFSLPLPFLLPLPPSLLSFSWQLSSFLCLLSWSKWLLLVTPPSLPHPSAFACAASSPWLFCFLFLAWLHPVCTWCRMQPSQVQPFPGSCPWSPQGWGNCPTSELPGSPVLIIPPYIFPLCTIIAWPLVPFSHCTEPLEGRDCPLLPWSFTQSVETSVNGMPWSNKVPSDEELNEHLLNGWPGE